MADHSFNYSQAFLRFSVQFLFQRQLSQILARLNYQAVTQSNLFYFFFNLEKLMVALITLSGCLVSSFLLLAAHSWLSLSLSLPSLSPSLCIIQGKNFRLGTCNKIKMLFETQYFSKKKQLVFCRLSEI